MTHTTTSSGLIIDNRKSAPARPPRSKRVSLITRYLTAPQVRLELDRNDPYDFARRRHVILAEDEACRGMKEAASAS